jgi:imidazolonepropionase
MPDTQTQTVTLRIPTPLRSYTEEQSTVDVAGAPVALATDFNPNCFSRAMPFAMTLACVGMRLTPGEALVAATAHAARALDLDDGRGTLREGAPADLAVVDAPSHVYLAYDLDVNRVETVVTGGEVVRRD